MLLTARDIGVALLAALCAGCSAGCGCSDGSGAPDGGRDAGTDTPRDAGPDAGRGAGRRDGGRDGGLDAGPPDPARWVPLPGLPDDCVIERAENPAALPEVRWVSCGDGCEYIAHDPDFSRGFDLAGWHDGTRGWFSVVHGDRTGRWVVLTPTEGRPVAAWRGPDTREPGLCQVGPTAIGEGAAAFGIRSWPEDGSPAWRLYHAPLDAIRAATEPHAVLAAPDVGSTGVQHIAVSSTTVVAEVQPAAVVLVFEAGAQRTLGGSGSPTPRIPQGVQVVGRTVWWEEWTSPIALVSGNITDGASYFYRVAPDDIIGMRVDGRDMAWMQAYWTGGIYEGAELWTARYTEDPASFAPRKVLDYPEWTTGATMGAGVYAFLRTNGRPRLELYDLADGRRRTLYVSDVPLVDNPLYITADELLAEGRVDRRPTLFRVQLASIPYD